MGLYDKFADAVKNFDYERMADSLRNSVERKQQSVERSAHEQYQQKARRASDEELRHNLDKALRCGNYIMQEEIEREMDRRGMYY